MDFCVTCGCFLWVSGLTIHELSHQIRFACDNVSGQLAREISRTRPKIFRRWRPPAANVLELVELVGLPPSGRLRDGSLSGHVVCAELLVRCIHPCDGPCHRSYRWSCQQVTSWSAWSGRPFAPSSPVPGHGCSSPRQAVARILSEQPLHRDTLARRQAAAIEKVKQRPSLRTCLRSWPIWPSLNSV